MREHLKLKQIDYYKHCVLGCAGRPAFAAGAADSERERECVCVFFRDLKISDTQRRHSFANSVTHSTERASGRRPVFCLTHADDRYEISSRTSARALYQAIYPRFIVYEIFVVAY